VISFHSEVARHSTKIKGLKQEAQVAKKKQGGGGGGGQQDLFKKSRKLQTQPQYQQDESVECGV
jgi:hypothetical protein